MHISQILKNDRPAISFEFFPPKNSEASTTLLQAMKDLIPLRPSYVSVTYGAGGTTREFTHDLIVKLKQETQLSIVSHLTCVGSTRQEIIEILEHYRQHGICNIMALRGDTPQGHNGQTNPFCGEFRYAGELVAFIKKHFPEFGIGVAGFPEGHPETPNRMQEMDYLKAKVDQGADYICTQLFFDNRDFYDFRERCLLAGIKIPIIAGIMPITSKSGMHKMAQLALGARYPAQLLKSLARAQNDDYVANVGIHWACEQVRDLIDNQVAGVHFYTLNRSKATMMVYHGLGVRDSAGLCYEQTQLRF